MSVSGFIQAGGESRRMGENKALIRLGQESLIERVAAALSPVVSELAIITNQPDLYRSLALPCYPDRWPGLGPLGGIGTALSYAANDRVLVLACDMPFVNRPFLLRLIELAGDYQLCLPQSHEGELQPLCALYQRNCLPAIIELIEQQQYAPRQLFTRVNARLLAFNEFADLAGAEHFFDNLNTPDDLARARARLLKT